MPNQHIPTAALRRGIAKAAQDRQELEELFVHPAAEEELPRICQELGKLVCRTWKEFETLATTECILADEVTELRKQNLDLVKSERRLAEWVAKLARGGKSDGR